MHFAKVIACAVTTLAGAAAAAAPTSSTAAAAPQGLGMVTCADASKPLVAPLRVEGCFAVPASDPPRYFSIGCPEDGSATPVHRDCGGDAACSKCKPGHAVASDTCFAIEPVGSSAESVPLPPFPATCASDAIRLADTRGLFDFLDTAWNAVVGAVVDATNTITQLITGDTWCKAKVQLRLKGSDCEFTGDTIGKGWPVQVVDGKEYKCGDVSMVKISGLTEKVGYAAFDDLSC